MTQLSASESRPWHGSVENDGLVWAQIDLRGVRRDHDTLTRDEKERVSNIPWAWVLFSLSRVVR